MSIRSRFFAATYDSFMKRAERKGLTDMRRVLMDQAAGRVLEIGGGTGLNLPHYGLQVNSLTITEPEPSMLKRLERRVEADRPATTVLRAPAEDLPFENGTFDMVVSTLVLCGVDDQPRAVREIRRVLRPGGSLLFLEHVRSDDPKAARMQDRMNWLNRLVVCCDCNRPTLHTIEDAGFEVESLQNVSMPKSPSFVRPAIVGQQWPQCAPVEASTIRSLPSVRAADAKRWTRHVAARKS
jgi:ubiquinone/menaquinone biosynthesis C-methylase UbiE